MPEIFPIAAGYIKVMHRNMDDPDFNPRIHQLVLDGKKLQYETSDVLAPQFLIVWKSHM